MQLLQFKAKYPVVDNGITWDKYWLQSLIITTSVFDEKVSLYAEFWLCRDVGENDKEIKQDTGGEEIKSIFVDDVFAVAEQTSEVGGVMGAIMQILNGLGIQQGFLEQ